MNAKSLFLTGLGALAALNISILDSQKANAAVLITGIETGGNVQFTLTGFLNTENLDQLATGPFIGGLVPGNINPSTAQILLNSVNIDNTNEIYYENAFTTAPSSFGFGSVTFASSFSGDVFGISNLSNIGFIGFSENYISGTPLSSLLTFTGATFDSLGITEGTYIYTLVNNDTVTLQIGNNNPNTSVPEPSGLLGLVLVSGIGATVRRRKNAQPLFQRVD